MAQMPPKTPPEKRDCVATAVLKATGTGSARLSLSSNKLSRLQHENQDVIPAAALAAAVAAAGEHGSSV